jgi:MFS family permease
MERGVARLVLAVLGAGAFLSGLELMITAVALPAIVVDLADWTELRAASWIINGYLLVSIVVMPLAGQLADRHGVRQVFLWSLVVFVVGSALAGRAATLTELIAARLVQAVGGGALVPVATAAASHLYGGVGRARALGVVGALTFLGMAAGPFVGATILQALVLEGTNVAALLTPAWRWIFYLGAPLALLAVVYVWAAAPNWQKPANPQPLDIPGAILFTIAVASGLLAITSIGSADQAMVFGLAGIFLGSLALALIRFSRAKSPFLDLHLFRDRTFSGATLLSLLTGYAFATAIIGGAVFVDRVRYGGPSEQQLVLGGLAGAVAIGALGSGFLLRRVGIVPLSLFGLVLSIGGLLWVSTATPSTALMVVVGGLALFGLGFGLTVTARSTAAVEAVGRASFGVASAGVTVARMLGMGIGLAALTVLGSNRIEALSVVLTDQAARDAVLPANLQGRPLEDYLVVNALESWAAGQAASILSTLFVVAAIVTAVAILPTLAMRNRPSERRAAQQLDEGVAHGVEEQAEYAL